MYKNIAVERLSPTDESSHNHPKRKKKKQEGSSVPYGSGYKKKKMSRNEAIDLIRGNLCIECGQPVNEDLRNWFKQKWVNIGKKTKSGKHPECGTSGDKKGYAKCVPASKASSMSKKEKESATRRKRSAQNKANRGGKKIKGQGRKPVRVSTNPEAITKESKTSNMMKAIRKHGTAGPWDIIVSKNNKVVKRVSVQNLKEIPAEMDDVKKKYPNHKIGIEAKSGKIAYREYVNEDNSWANNKAMKKADVAKIIKKDLALIISGGKPRGGFNGNTGEIFAWADNNSKRGMRYTISVDTVQDALKEL